MCGLQITFRDFFFFVVNFFFYISKRVDGKRQDGAEEKNEVRGSRLFLLSV